MIWSENRCIRVKWYDKCYYKNGKFQDLPFTYDNIIRVSACLSDSFEEFVNDLINDDVETFSVTDMLKNM